MKGFCHMPYILKILGLIALGVIGILFLLMIYCLMVAASRADQYLKDSEQELYMKNYYELHPKKKHSA